MTRYCTVVVLAQENYLHTHAIPHHPLALVKLYSWALSHVLEELGHFETLDQLSVTVVIAASGNLRVSRSMKVPLWACHDKNQVSAISDHSYIILLRKHCTSFRG